MGESSQVTVTRLLHEMQAGNRSAVNKLFPLVYEALHARARRHRRNWHGDFTLNTTALVHEAYIKLVDQSQAPWDNRAHFLGVAAKAMRNILVDYSRRRKAEKRGGDAPKLSLEEMKVVDEAFTLTEERADTLVALDEALKRLARESPREAQVVECRFFGGMTIAETAGALGISPATVKRSWAIAQAWLYRDMMDDEG